MNLRRKIDKTSNKEYTGIKLDDICQFTKDSVVRHNQKPYWVCTHGFAINEASMPGNLEKLKANHKTYTEIGNDQRSQSTR